MTRGPKTFDYHSDTGTLTLASAEKKLDKKTTKEKPTFAGSVNDAYKYWGHTGAKSAT